MKNKRIILKILHAETAEKKHIKTITSARNRPLNLYLSRGRAPFGYVIYVICDCSAICSRW